MPHRLSYFLCLLLPLLTTGCQDIDSTNKQANCGYNSDILNKYIVVPSGYFSKDDRPFYPEETIPKDAFVKAFKLLAHEVTNQQFAAFVKDTGYLTDAERYQTKREDAGSALFTLDESNPNNGKWLLEKAATWQTPSGNNSSLDGKDTFPVVHVSNNDAKAYAKWAGGRLPTEREWEYAALLGLKDKNNQLSGAFNEKRQPIANTWQGVFPLINTGEDGFKLMAPIGCFKPDQIGAYDMIGNVWEWTATAYADKTHVIKGGSYLCSPSYCKRYRPAARQPHESRFSSNHIGFRMVKEWSE